MKIGPVDNSKPVAPASGNASSATAAKPAPAPAQPEASAKVALSQAASLRVSNDNAEFDAEKVARIAQAIRDGKFEVDAEAIADKLIVSARELLTGPKP